MAIPTRRSLLRVGGSLFASGFLAGCTSLNRPSSRAEIVSRTIHLENIDTSEILDGHDVSVDVEVVEPAVTADHTARIRATFTNEGPKRKFSGFGRFVPLNAQVSGPSGTAGLLLLPTTLTASGDSASPYESYTRNLTNGCWSATLYRASGPSQTVTLDTGEEATQTLELWDNGEIEGCMPPGTYQFSGSYSLGRFRYACKIGRATDCNEDAAERNWTFTLSVRDE